MSSADQSHIACADEQVEPHQTEDEHVYLLTYNRAPEKFRVALVEGNEREGCRDSLRDHSFAYVWESSAKVFVHPWQYEDILENLQASKTSPPGFRGGAGAARDVAGAWGDTALPLPPGGSPLGSSAQSQT